jgi:hypothetical protein
MRGLGESRIVSRQRTIGERRRWPATSSRPAELVELAVFGGELEQPACECVAELAALRCVEAAVDAFDRADDARDRRPIRSRASERV